MDRCSLSKSLYQLTFFHILNDSAFVNAFEKSIRPLALALLGFHSSSESLSEGITGEGHFDFLFLRIKSGIGAGKPVKIKLNCVFLA